jgi:hypothetical protein
MWQHLSLVFVDGTDTGLVMPSVQQTIRLGTTIADFSRREIAVNKGKVPRRHR